MDIRQQGHGFSFEALEAIKAYSRQATKSRKSATNSHLLEAEPRKNRVLEEIALVTLKIPLVSLEIPLVTLEITLVPLVLVPLILVPLTLVPLVLEKLENSRNIVKNNQN